MISPYLTRPLRTIEEALRDCGRSAAFVGLADAVAPRPCAARPGRGDVLVRLLLSGPPEPGGRVDESDAAKARDHPRNEGGGRRAA